MKTLVTYISETGNTQKLAEEIFNSIDEEKVLKPIKEVDSTDGFELIYVGFPMHMFQPIKEARAFLLKLKENQKVVLFITHAIPTGTPVNNQQLDNCEKVTGHLNVLGMYSCQGELSEAVAQKMIQSPNKQWQFFGRMRDQTIGHPNEEELVGVRQFVAEIHSSTI